MDIIQLVLGIIGLSLMVWGITTYHTVGITEDSIIRYCGGLVLCYSAGHPSL